MFWDFAQISDKSKLLGVRCHRLHPQLLHHSSRTMKQFERDEKLIRNWFQYVVFRIVQNHSE